MEKLLYLLQGCRCAPWSETPNKIEIPLTEWQISDREKFNGIYKACRDSGLLQCKPTRSGGIPFNHMVKRHERYMIYVRPISFELDICTFDGMWRIVLLLGKKAVENTVTGAEALKCVIKMAKNYGVLDTFERAAVDTEEGKKIKETIESPIIAAASPKYIGQEIDNVHHLDFNSSYASRIAEAHPELREMYEYLYNHRKQANGYYKHVLTNSVGFMQSQYCYDVKKYGAECFHRSPYSLAAFARDAVNGTNRKIEEYTFRLESSGRRPILYNTDGIWYQGDIYHDENEGAGLCQWKNDVINSRLYVKSKGAYQYIESGKVHSVVRGYTRLDITKPDRSTWGWREIDDFDRCCVYKWDDAEGVTRDFLE